MPDTTPDTIAGIHARYREIAPTPDPESTDPSMAVAVSLLVAAQRANTLLLTPGEPLEHNLINTMCAQFAVVHLLRWLRENHPVDAARLSWEINGAWEDGGGVGEWLWEHAQALGIDPGEVNRLVEAEVVLRGEKRGAEASTVAALTQRAEKAEAERDGLARLLHRYESITTAWTRGMYSARIDCWRGDAKAAVSCLSEGLDGYDGTEWDGTETGTEWWERTKAEEGLSASPPAEPAAAATGGE